MSVMTKDERTKFVAVALEIMQQRLSEAIDLAPESWGGYEMRELLADMGASWSWKDKMDRGAVLKYNTFLREYNQSDAAQGKKYPAFPWPRR